MLIEKVAPLIVGVLAPGGCITIHIQTMHKITINMHI